MLPNYVPEHDSSISWLVNVPCEGVACCLLFKVKLTFSHRLLIIKVYYAVKSYAKVKEEFKNEYPESGNIPNSTIKR